MSNNIAIRITTDVADLQVKRAILSSELKAANKDLNDFAKTARASGMTDELRAKMVSSAGAVAKFRSETREINEELKKLSEGAVKPGEAIANVFSNAKAKVIEGAAEKIGVFGGALEALGPIGLAAGAAVAAVGVGMEKAVEGAEWAEKLKKASTTLGLTTTQLQEFDFVFNSVGIDVARGRETLSSLEKTIGMVESGLARSSQTKAFTEGLKIKPEDLRGWGTLDEQLPHIVEALSKLDPEERAAVSERLKIDPEVVTGLIEARERIHELIEEAHKYGIVLSPDVIDKSAEAAAKMKEWKAIIDGELRSAFISLAPLMVGAAHYVADMSNKFADFMAGVNHVAGDVGHFAQEVEKALGPVGTFLAQIPKLTDKLGGLKGILEQMVNPLHNVVEYLTKIGAADRKADDKKTGEAPKPPGKPVVLAPPKTSGPSIVSQWAEQLHAQEIAAKNYFGDQTHMELDFWNKKVGLVAKGSKDWIEIQSKIYDLQKKLAHDKYNEDLADLNDQIGAQKDSWAKEQELWNQKLALIKSKFKEQSAEYKNAHREYENAEREHNQRMLQMEREAAQAQISQLKQTLSTNAEIRERNAQTAAAALQSKARYSANPLAEVNAEKQVAALNQQVAQQKIADLDAAYQAEDRLAAKQIADAQKAAGANFAESEAYKKAVQAKQQADTAYYNQRRNLESQATNQAIQDQERIKAAWHSKVDPMVSATGSAIKGLINGTESWGQALQKIGESIEDAIITAIEKMVEEWIVAQIVAMTGQQATTKTGVLAAAGLAGANGVASMAGAPWPLDMTAPAFGASMAATAMSFGAFDKGLDMVPQDMIAQIHQGERIVPRADNAALIAAAQGGVARGATHITNNLTHAPVVNGGSPDVVRHLEANKRDFARLLKSMARDGHFKAA